MDKILLIKILYAAASLQGLFLAVLLLRTRVNAPANRILGSLLLILSFHLILVGFDERDFFMTFPHLSRISWILGTIYGPLVLLFIQRLTHLRPESRWLNYLMWAPFALVFFSLLPYYLQSAEAKRAYLSVFEKSVQDDFGWVNQFVSGVQVFFVGFNLYYYKQWERLQSNEFSALEFVRVKWLAQFLMILFVVTLFGVVVFFAHIFEIDWLGALYRFHFIGAVFLFYWLSYQALTRPVIFGIVTPDAPVAPVVPSDEKYKKSKLEGESLAAVFEQVKSTLVAQRLFLKNDLTLTELADRSGLPKHQVSQAINSLYNGNFFDLINDFRVEEFKKQARNPEKKHLSLLGIALESGFNSKASFYAVFKKKTGLTPSEYLDKHA